jgi:glycosyltransferase involved in cell wall biosynthesis
VRIFLLTDSDAFAGTEQHMLSLAVALRNAGQEVYVGSPEGSPLSARCAFVGISTVSINKRGAIDTAAAVRCARHIRKERIDVLHAHNARTALIASLVRVLIPSIKVVFTQHFIAPSHSSRKGLQRRLSDLVHKFIAAGIDQIVCVSNATRDALLSRQGPYTCIPSCVIYNGIDFECTGHQRDADLASIRAELNIPTGTRVVLVASRLEPEKQVDIAIRAFANQVRDNPDTLLLIAGQGSLLSDLQRITRDLNIEDSVQFIGFRSDIQILMSLSDVFVFTSPVDSFGLTILEAMSMGTPVIAANAGGPSEIIDDGKTGFLFLPGDVADLNRKLNVCLSTNEIVQVTEQAMRRISLEFSTGRMAENTIGVYESVNKRVCK